MVRIVSQGFSTPRSRHSSGEDMIERFAALKSSTSALSDDEKLSVREDFSPKSLVIDCNTDTNDSFSGVDSDNDSRGFSRDRENNNEQPYPEPSLVKKERRRERNKVSAQNYRQRRRQQVSAAQKTLETLEVRNKNLLDTVRQLEAEKHIVEEYLKNCVRMPWCPFHQTGSVPSSLRSTPTIPEDPSDLTYTTGSSTGIINSTESTIVPTGSSDIRPTQSPPRNGATPISLTAPCCGGACNHPQQAALDNCRPMAMATRDDNDNNNNEFNGNRNVPVFMQGFSMMMKESSAS
ncbi:putative uncharacterized protein DDB_G0271982 [Dreissena polymorpha]|uniref:BZIP domain-containing protein n=1 Tax=Dreissena polymorpha TaxID=45954 RepID=A0A9D4R3I0_DREPO|nr:putative uncharacterized protein DDB_G0271982 [Dreissena polymorpha]KAH3852868.1 hypothetical protein DPMN_095389 [Dreissena polymorpha]